MNTLNIGAIFPHTEIGTDPGALRTYAQAVEGMGFTHILSFDHVIGASAKSYSKEILRGAYRETDLFHEPLVLFGFLAGITKTLKFATSILIAPQRQTVLLAKQAAELDVLSGGRFRLGIGTGWNWVEYEALGVPVAERGARQEEQIRLMRELWSKPLVTFKGKYHTVMDAGINPLPMGKSIPIWLGGMAAPVLRRVATLADGWFPQFPSMNQQMTFRPERSTEAPKVVVDRMRKYAREAGRNPDSIGIEGILIYANQTPEVWANQVAIYRDLGANFVSINTLRAGLNGVDDHIAALRRFKESV